MIPHPSSKFYDNTQQKGWKPCLNLLKLEQPADQQMESIMLLLPFISSLCLPMQVFSPWLGPSRVRLCATPWTAAHQAPPSLGFSSQEHWSGLPFPSPMHESEK